jgi:hypothetical protein
MASKTIPKNILDVINDFFQHLGKKSKDIVHIANLQCGFEKWLQLEFIFWAINKFNLIPMNVGNNHKNNYRHGIGIEHYTELESPNRKWKMIDIWVNPIKNKFYYIEFKSIVKDWNEGKQISSWVDDFNNLQLIHEDYEPFGVASVLFGTTQNDWKEPKWEEYIKERMLISFPTKPFFETNGQLGVAILHKQY